MTYKFLNEAEQWLANEWLERHRETCEPLPSCIGGDITYSFTPTSIGTVVRIKCTCGEQADLSNYEDW